MKGPHAAGLEITYLGNFLSKHGWNPTYTELLTEKMAERGITVRKSSSFLSPAARLADMAAAVFKNSVSRIFFIDLYSGPRAFPAAQAVVFLCAALGRPYVLVMHGGNLADRLRKDGACLRKMLKRARAVVAPSRYFAEIFSEVREIKIIPNAVDINVYRFELRRRPQPRFLFLRTFHRYHNPAAVIRAFKTVSEKYPQAVLSMMGPDEDGTLAECRKTAGELGLSSKINFGGRVEKTDIARVMSGHDIFVHASLIDNTPVTVVEAMASGMCIVASTAGGVPYMLQDEKTALLADPRDERAIAAAMQRFLKDPAMAETCSRNARAAAEAFDWNRVLPDWLDLIEKAGA